MSGGGVHRLLRELQMEILKSLWWRRLYPLACSLARKRGEGGPAILTTHRVLRLSTSNGGKYFSWKVKFRLLEESSASLKQNQDKLAAQLQVAQEHKSRLQNQVDMGIKSLKTLKDEFVIFRYARMVCRVGGCMEETCRRIEIAA